MIWKYQKIGEKTAHLPASAYYCPLFNRLWTVSTRKNNTNHQKSPERNLNSRGQCDASMRHLICFLRKQVALTLGLEASRCTVRKTHGLKPAKQWFTKKKKLNRFPSCFIFFLPFCFSCFVWFFFPFLQIRTKPTSGSILCWRPWNLSTRRKVFLHWWFQFFSHFLFPLPFVVKASDGNVITANQHTPFPQRSGQGSIRKECPDLLLLDFRLPSAHTRTGCYENQFPWCDWKFLSFFIISYRPVRTTGLCTANPFYQSSSVLSDELLSLQGGPGYFALICSPLTFTFSVWV